jgi:hypothetical protein
LWQVVHVLYGAYVDAEPTTGPPQWPELWQLLHSACCAVWSAFAWQSEQVVDGFTPSAWHAVHPGGFVPVEWISATSELWQLDPTQLVVVDV